MTAPQKSLFAAFLALAAVLAPLPAPADEPKGSWVPPSNDGKPWKHDPTQLSFPQFVGDYRFTGHFTYEKETGTLLRYENLEEQARLDIFLFKLTPPPAALEDMHRRILTEMDVVTMDLENMAKQGRYKNLVIGDTVGGNLDLWQKQSIPIATSEITATRMSVSDRGSVEAVIRQWVGITILDGYLITMRHVRPSATGEAGQEGMKTIMGLMFQLLKDPSLRTHIRELVDQYLKDPLSAQSDEASAAVLAYLKQTPYFPINIPEDPVSSWLQHCKAVAPGTEEALLRAFMLGSAKPALDGADAATCLREGGRQFAKVYRILVAKQPQITRPLMEEFVTAAEKGEGTTWMKQRGYFKG